MVPSVSIRKFAQRLFVVVILLVIAFGDVSKAIPRNDLKDINRGTPAYKSSGEDSCESSTGGGGGGGDEDTDPGEISQTKDEFLRKYVQAAYNNSLKTGVPYEFTLAQAILEGALTSELALKYNNLFGIKADSSWTGKTVELWTKEWVDGRYISVLASWRVYDNPEDSFADHDRFLRENPRYAKAFQFSNDPFKFLAEVAAAGYATEPNYYNLVAAIIREVIQWVAENTDLPPSSEVTYDITDPVPGGGGGGGSSGCSSDSIGSAANLECPGAGETLETITVGDTTYYKLPEAPNGEYTIYASERRRYGKKELVCAIYTVAKAYKVKYDGRSKVSVGDLNGGAPHKSHRWGIAVDIDAPGQLYAADHTKGNYSSEATVDFGKLWVDTGLLKNIWWCQPGGDNSTEQIIEYARSTGKPLSSMECKPGHDNHFHVDINVAKGAEHAP